MKTKKCCLCGKEIEVEFTGWSDGNNAQPLADGRCCNDCNTTKVIPARIELYRDKYLWKQHRDKLIKELKSFKDEKEFMAWICYTTSSFIPSLHKITQRSPEFKKIVSGVMRRFNLEDEK